MPRQPRLDAPGALHHIMGRGIERTGIFRTDQDREDFLNRLADLCVDGSKHKRNRLTIALEDEPGRCLASTRSVRLR
jgi:hypothetical protein